MTPARPRLPPDAVWVAFGESCGLPIIADTTKVGTACCYCVAGTCKVLYARYRLATGARPSRKRPAKTGKGKR